MLILVRHGRTAANAAGLLQGRVDHDLDEAGRAQAVAIARVLEGVDRVVTSPLRRARATAEAFGDGVGISVDDRWIELDYGRWDEMPIAEMAAEDWRVWRADPGFTPPGGESLSTLQARVARACDELVEECGKADVAVVTHVSPIKAAVSWALGAGAATTWRLHVAQASISRIRMGPNGPVLASFNEVSHLVG